MADIDNIDSFGDHDKTVTYPDETGETIPPTPFTPGGAMGGGSTWEPEPEQKTPFRGGRI